MTSGLAIGTIAVAESDSGAYSGELPLSDFAASVPHFTVTLDSGDSFIWALLAVALGALLGGGVYLASNLKRRKDLLAAYVRDSLEEYVDRRDQLAAASSPGPMPLWEITGLGAQEHWFQRKWTALPQIAGVQGIWSQIIWARNAADLDAVQTDVLALLARLQRWLRLATGEDVPTLQSAFRLQPADPANATWLATRTYADPSMLLRRLVVRSRPTTMLRRHCRRGSCARHAGTQPSLRHGT